MSKKLFLTEDIDILSKNKYVKKVIKKVLHILISLKCYLLLKMKKENFQEIYWQSVVSILI